MAGFIVALVLVTSWAPTPAAAQNDAALKTKIIELTQAGKFSDAISLAQQLLTTREKAFGPNHPNVAVAVDILAGVYTNQGRYTDAEPLYKRALAIAEKAFGPDNPDVATVMTDLAIFYQNQQRFADAEPLFKRALAIRQSAFGPEHPTLSCCRFGGHHPKLTSPVFRTPSG
jgi:tetratricopeptide (TPR) repeat protein